MAINPSAYRHCTQITPRTATKIWTIIAHRISIDTLCPAPPALQVADADTIAEWRHQRLSTLEFIHRQKELGKKISPIFSVQGVSNRIFRFDWLHAVDQGVALCSFAVPCHFGEEGLEGIPEEILSLIHI